MSDSEMSPASKTSDVHRLVMRQTTTDEGKPMWWIDAPDFYCDVEQKPNGVFSVYFRHKESGREIFHDA
jgi:hypothetical protein